MGINSNGWLAEGLIQNNVCCLATNTGQFNQLLAGLRHLAVKLIQDHLAECDDIFGLIAP